MNLLANIGVMLLVAFLLYRNNRQRKKVNTALENTLAELNAAQTSPLPAMRKMNCCGRKFINLSECILGSFRAYKRVQIECAMNALIRSK